LAEKAQVPGNGCSGKSGTKTSAVEPSAVRRDLAQALADGAKALTTPWPVSHARCLAVSSVALTRGTQRLFGCGQASSHPITSGFQAYVTGLTTGVGEQWD
ncbi:hypothetical protein RRG08_041010, partial [Elysia crispata]